MEVLAPNILNFSIEKGECSALPLGRSFSRATPGTYWIRIWWVPEPAGQFEEEYNMLPLPGIEPRLVGVPARSLVAIPSEAFSSCPNTNRQFIALLKNTAYWNIEVSCVGNFGRLLWEWPTKRYGFCCFGRRFETIHEDLSWEYFAYLQSFLSLS
jgi:hypothetical protein